MCYLGIGGTNKYNTKYSQEPLVFRVLRSSRVYFPPFLPLAEIWNKKSDKNILKPNWAFS